MAAVRAVVADADAMRRRRGQYISHKAMQRQLDVNLVGHVRVAHSSSRAYGWAAIDRLPSLIHTHTQNTMTAVLVALLRESKGRIVNIVSCAGRQVRCC